MSLFGSLLGDIDDDPFFGGHMRQMNRMMRSMNSMFGQPLGVGGLLGGPMVTDLMPFGGGGAMMPFGVGGVMPGMNHLFQSMEQLGNSPNCHSYSSSTVMTMSSGPDGRPQVYQASQSVRQGPGGVKETKKAVADSRTGVKKMAIGHHIGDRAHIIEREQNLRTGDREERQDYINLEEDEADEFNNEWRERASRHFSSRRPHHAIGSGYPSYSSGRRHRDLPALPASSSPETSTSSPNKSRKRHLNDSDDEASDCELQPKVSKASKVEITEISEEDEEK